jgi:hypothetical protein
MTGFTIGSGEAEDEAERPQDLSREKAAASVVAIGT